MSHRVEERAVALQSAKTIRTVGLDFGTTNSALAVVHTDGTVQLATFQDNGQVATTFRSVLYFLHPEEDDYGEPHVVAGPQAIRRYLRADPKGRFMQSIKSFLASHLFERTHVFTRRYTLEDSHCHHCACAPHRSRSTIWGSWHCCCSRTPGAFCGCATARR